jgi:hypothetical protein
MKILAMVRIGLFCLSLLLLIGGCRATGKKFEPVVLNPNDGLSVIYFYREPGFGGSANTPTLYFDDEELVDLPIGSYSYVITSPGMHRLFVADGVRILTEFDISTNLFVRPNEELYVEIWGSIGSNDIVPKAMARKNIEGIALIPPLKEKIIQEVDIKPTGVM